MKRLGLLGMAVLALCAFGTLAANTAFALPEHLPSGPFTGNSDGKIVPILEAAAGTKVECAKAKGAGEDTSDTLGTFTITFEECKTPSFFNAKCNTSGDPAGIILSTGEYHYVYDSLSPLGIAILFLPNETVFECSTFLKTKVKSQSANGGLVCLILEPTVKQATHLFHCEQEKGVQKEKIYWNDTPKEITNAELLCSLNGGGFEKCGELALAEITLKTANSWEKV